MCGLVTFYVEGHDSGDLKQQLSEKHAVTVSTSHPSSTLIDATQRGIPVVVRASVHYYNSGGELEAFVRALADIIGAPVAPDHAEVAVLASI